MPVEQSESRSHDPLQQLTLRVRAGQDTHSQSDAEQQPGEIGGVTVGRRRAVGLRRAYGTPEKRFELAEARRHLRPKLRVVRRSIERGIHQQAAPPIAVDRTLDDPVEKGVYCLFRW